LVKCTVKNSRDKINVIFNRELEAMSSWMQTIFVFLLRREELAKDMFFIRDHFLE